MGCSGSKTVRVGPEEAPTHTAAPRWSAATSSDGEYVEATLRQETSFSDDAHSVNSDLVPAMAGNESYDSGPHDDSTDEFEDVSHLSDKRGNNWVLIASCCVDET